MAQVDVTPDAQHARRAIKRLLRQLDRAMFMTQEAEADVDALKPAFLRLSETEKIGSIAWKSANRTMAKRVRLVRQRRTAMLKLCSQASDLARLRLERDDELYREAYLANQRALIYAVQLERRGY